MKNTLKKIGIGLLGFIVLLVLIVLLLPSERRLETSITIDAPLQLVFDQVLDMRHWEMWLPWKTLDPEIEYSFSNPPAGKDAFMRWRSTHKQVGTGRITIIEVVPQKHIVLVINAEKAKDNRVVFEFEEEQRHVKVVWSMTDKAGKNPVRKIRAFFESGAVRKSFSQGLISIRSILENR